jgi:hypothetical protein
MTSLGGCEGGQAEMQGWQSGWYAGRVVLGGRGGPGGMQTSRQAGMCVVYQMSATRVPHLTLSAVLCGLSQGLVISQCKKDRHFC